MGIVTDLQPIATFTVVANLGTEDEWGEFTPGTGGDIISLAQCHIEIENVTVLDSNNVEVISRGSVFSLEDNSLFSGVNASGQSYRFTLPISWPEPRTLIKPINIIRNEDDEGQVYEEIVL